MAVVKIQHITFLLFISGVALVNGGLNECTTEQVEMCGKKLQDFDQSTWCDGALVESKACWDGLFDTCDGTQDQIDTKAQALTSINASMEGCATATTASSGGVSTCADGDVETCEKNMAEVQGGFCRQWDSSNKCWDQLVVNCLNMTVKDKLNKDIMDNDKKFADDKCCPLMDISKCRDGVEEVTNSTATKEKCKTIYDAHSCLKKFNCGEEDIFKEVTDHLEKYDGYMDICESAGYTKDGGDSGIAIQPTLMLVFSAFVCALYGLYV